MSGDMSDIDTEATDPMGRTVAAASGDGLASLGETVSEAVEESAGSDADDSVSGALDELAPGGVGDSAEDQAGDSAGDAVAEPPGSPDFADGSDHASHAATMIGDSGDVDDTDNTAQSPEAAGAAGSVGQGEVSGDAAASAPNDETMRGLGHYLAGFVRPGDLLVLTGVLGAGKTTLIQGLGAGMGVEEPVTSPTFVIARVHQPPSDVPPLVHVDAYRLGGVEEIDDLDLDTPAEQAVTVVEWGEGMVEHLADERLEVTIELGAGEERLVRLTGVGERWQRALRGFDFRA